MGQFANADETLSLEEQIKSLGDDELLDFWEETQHLSKLMGGDVSLTGELPLLGELPLGERLPPEYERLILQELQVRSCRRELR